MRYVVAKDQKPIDDVDVYVVTEEGVKCAARYWRLTNKWLAKDKNIMQVDVIKNGNMLTQYNAKLTSPPCAELK